MQIRISILWPTLSSHINHVVDPKGDTVFPDYFRGTSTTYLPRPIGPLPLNQSINFIVCLGTYAQIHQTIYMFSAEWKTSHSWHSCKKCATLTGGLRVIRSDKESASLNRSAKSNLATSYFGQSNMA